MTEKYDVVVKDISVSNLKVEVEITKIMKDSLTYGSFLDEFKKTKEFKEQFDFIHEELSDKKGYFLPNAEYLIKNGKIKQPKECYTYPIRKMKTKTLTFNYYPDHSRVKTRYRLNKDLKKLSINKELLEGELNQLKQKFEDSKNSRKIFRTEKKKFEKERKKEGFKMKKRKESLKKIECEMKKKYELDENENKNISVDNFRKKLKEFTSRLLQFEKKEAESRFERIKEYSKFEKREKEKDFKGIKEELLMKIWKEEIHIERQRWKRESEAEILRVSRILASTMIFDPDKNNREDKSVQVSDKIKINYNFDS